MTHRFKSLPGFAAALALFALLLATGFAPGVVQAMAASALVPRAYLPLVARSGDPQTPFILPKGPTLIYTGQNSEMKIFWQGTGSAVFRLDWGEDLRTPAGSADVQEMDPQNHLYAYTIRGLKPGTAYQYRVVLGDAFSDGSFRTAPDASTTGLKFDSNGDTRTNPDLHDAVAAQILALIRSDPQYQTLNLMVGDWVSDGDSAQSWVDELFAPQYSHIRALLGSVAYLSAMGNHEGSGVLFQRYFPLQYAASRYGSFDYGPAHIILLDQYVDYGPGSAQRTWFQQDLAASQKTWKFVVLHEPGWSAGGGHPNNLQVQNEIQPLLEQYHVAILFAGHNHYYARAEVNGVTHLTVGTGGAPLNTPQSGQPNVAAAYMGTGYTRIEISGRSLNGWLIGSDGLVHDSFSVTR